MGQKVTIKEIEKALIEKKGIVTDAAKQLGITRRQVYYRIKKSQRLQDALREGRETMKDVAEGMLHKGIREGDRVLIMFYLKTQAKDRGYVERQETTGADGGPLVIKGYTNVNPDEWPD